MHLRHRHLGRGLVAAVAATVLIVPAAADAASVKVDRGKLVYTALPLEANVLTATSPSPGVVALSETGRLGILPVLIAPGSGCSGFAQRVTCSGVSSMALNMGDGPGDVVDSSGVPLPTQVTTGNGDDRVTTGAGNDNINTRDGNDVLDGGLGNDVFTGGPGTGDVVSYASHSASEPVVATLDGIQNDGCAVCGESDRIGPDVEGIVGGSGDDTLTGGAGDDTIDGGPGTDTEDGGPGNDTILARDGSPDRLGCGTGNDGGSADPGDSVGSDCEFVARAIYDPGQAPDADQPAGIAPISPRLFNIEPPRIPAQTAAVTASGVALVQVVCPAAAGACKGSVDLLLTSSKGSARRGRIVAARRRKVTKLGHTKFAAKAGAKPIVRVRLNRRGRRRILRRRHTRCRMVVTTRSADGKVVTTTRNITLRPRRAKR